MWYGHTGNFQNKPHALMEFKEVHLFDNETLIWRYAQLKKIVVVRAS